MITKLPFFLLLLMLSAFSVEKLKPITIACIGDSITYGYLVENREQNSYPAQLQKLLGNNFKVYNFGVPSKTVLTKGGKSVQSYVDTKEYKKALQTNADIILIMLGANDSKPNNWTSGKKWFSQDFKILVESLKTKTSKIYCCIPTSIQNNLKPMADNLKEIIRHEKAVADKLNLSIIDLNTPTMNKPKLFIDGLHPNKKGCEVIAKIIAKNITEAKK